MENNQEVKDKLVEQLSKYGTIQTLKIDYVFTVLLTGKGLSNWQTINLIQLKILNLVGFRYPIVEVIKNEDNFFLMVLKPK